MTILLNPIKENVTIVIFMEWFVEKRVRFVSRMTENHGSKHRVIIIFTIVAGHELNNIMTFVNVRCVVPNKIEIALKKCKSQRFFKKSLTQNRNPTEHFLKGKNDFF
jgi:hypothetical protein